jgi:hypothetical protein
MDRTGRLPHFRGHCAYGSDRRSRTYRAGIGIELSRMGLDVHTGSTPFSVIQCIESMRIHRATVFYMHRRSNATLVVLCNGGQTHIVRDE